MTDKTQIAAMVRDTVATALGHSVNPHEDVGLMEPPAWDSLKHVEIMLMLEETFGIVLDPEDFELMTSIEACVAQVIARLEEPAPG